MRKRNPYAWLYAALAALAGGWCCCPHAQADDIRVQADGNRRVSVTVGAQRQIGLLGRWMQARDGRAKAKAEAAAPKIIAVPEGSTLLHPVAPTVLPAPLPPRPRIVIE